MSNMRLSFYQGLICFVLSIHLATAQAKGMPTAFQKVNFIGNDERSEYAGTRNLNEIKENFVKGNGDKKQYLLESDYIEYNKKENIITAKGHVEIFRENYLLKADKIIYNKDTNRAIATGNVLLVRPNGEEFYATSLELDDGLKELVADALKARLMGNNVFTADFATGSIDEIVFNKATYSPCEICQTTKPQWQIRSSHIDYARKKDTVFVNNLFDLYGIPIFYLPYMRVAAHDAEPRSGFLFPNNYKYRSIYGHGIAIPYYLRINNSNDFTYAPTITSTAQVLHSGKYRFMLQKETTNTIYAEYIKNTHKVIYKYPRGESYLKGNLYHKINEKVNFKSDIEVVSDKSYLKNYHDINKNYLRSFGELKYLGENCVFDGMIHHFQELRTFASGHTDITVAPTIEYDTVILKDANRYIFNADAANIAKKNQGKIEKATAKLTWLRNYQYKNHEINVSGAANFGIYKFLHADNVNKNYSFGRAIPEFTTAWQYPLLLTRGTSIAQITPIFKLIALPPNTQNKHIINEDSQEIDITDSNIFDTNRYPGSDRIETGTWLAYGIKGGWYLYDAPYPMYNFLIGQNYRFQKSRDYSINSGLNNTHFSDYVGMLSVKTSAIIDLQYMFQVDKNDYVFRSNELASILTFEPPGEINKVVLDFRLSAYNYKVNTDNVDKSISAGIEVYFLKEWSVGTHITENFFKGAMKPIETKFNLGYKGQCTNVIFSAIKDSTKDSIRKIRKGGFSYLLEVHLKNIN